MTATFSQAVRSFYSKYAQFQGRASVAQYWWVALWLAIPGFIISPIIACCDPGSFGFTFWNIILYSWYLINLIPGLALTVRRLHDTNRGGGWIFIGLVPLIGEIWLLILLLLPSFIGPNRFGDREYN